MPKEFQMTPLNSFKNEEVPFLSFTPINNSNDEDHPKHSKEFNISDHDIHRKVLDDNKINKNQQFIKNNTSNFKNQHENVQLYKRSISQFEENKNSNNNFLNCLNSSQTKNNQNQKLSLNFEENDTRLIDLNKDFLNGINPIGKNDEVGQNLYSKKS